MKLLLLGAGYVGTALLRTLNEQGYDLVVTTTSAEKVQILKPYAQVLLLEEPGILENGIQACEGLLILIAPKNGATYLQTYLHTAQRVQAALKKRHKPLYLLYTSSTAVYEGITTEWATEEMPLAPKSEYAKILWQTEKTYLQHSNSCILRLGGIYGPDRDLEQRARQMSGKQIASAGDEPTNHIHRDDIVRAISFSLDQRLTGVYNLVNNEHPTREQLYGGLCKMMDLPQPSWAPVPNAPAKPKVSNKKITNAGFACVQANI